MGQLKSSPLLASARLWKGAYYPDWQTRFKPGTEFTDHGFLSMTRSRNVAEYFVLPTTPKSAGEDAYWEALDNADPLASVLFTASFKAGTKAAPVDVVGGGPNKINQHELLFARGTRFRVKKWSSVESIEIGHEMAVIELEHIP